MPEQGDPVRPDAEELRRKLEAVSTEELLAEIDRRIKHREDGWQESYRAYNHWRLQAEKLARELAHR